MGLFHYDEEEEFYVANVKGLRFICEEESQEIEEKAQELAEIYESKVPEIVEFIMEDVVDFWGDISKEELSDALGVPEIDCDIDTLTYVEHTLDDVHIITVEFDGLLEELLMTSIDG